MLTSTWTWSDMLSTILGTLLRSGRVGAPGGTSGLAAHAPHRYLFVEELRNRFTDCLRVVLVNTVGREVVGEHLFEMHSRTLLTWVVVISDLA